jgi:hypothetical protein
MRGTEARVPMASDLWSEGSRTIIIAGMVMERRRKPESQ